MGISGRAGAGAIDALQQVFRQQVVEEELRLREEAEARQAERDRVTAEIARGRESREEREFQSAEADRQRARDLAAYQQTARANMSELGNHPDQLAAFSLTSGVDLPKTATDAMKTIRDDAEFKKVLDTLPEGPARQLAQLRKVGVTGVTAKDLTGATDMENTMRPYKNERGETVWGFGEDIRGKPVGSTAQGGGDGAKVIAKIPTQVEGQPFTMMVWSDGTREMIPGAISAGERKSMAETGAALESMDKLYELFKPEYVGPVAGRRGAASEVIPGMTVDPESAAFRAANAALRNEIVKLVTGAQMSEPEADRILQQVPDITNKPEVWIQRFEQTKLNRERLLAKQKQITGAGAAAGGAGVDVKRDKDGRLIVPPG